MQIVEVVPAVSTAEHVDLVFVRVGCMHVAWARGLTCELEVNPFEKLQIKNVHVICGEWALPEPSANYVKSVL